MYDIHKYFRDTETDKAYEEIFKNLIVVDSHVHLGEDKDKQKLSAKKLIKIMDRSGINKCIPFPLNNPDFSKTFSKPNDIILKGYKKYPERIIPFFRLNPNFDEWKEELKKRVEQGFKGIKLHPRSQTFRINSGKVRDILDKAEKHELLVLFHTGFGVKYLADDIKNILKRYPKVNFILGHSAFPDIRAVIKKVGERNNVLFETSSVRIFDLFDLLRKVSNKKIIFGSDAPYYDQNLALEMLVDTALTLHKTTHQIKDMLGGNIIKWLK
jgi:predicted TIM-barrel fold metal-dependent hydrolase